MKNTKAFRITGTALFMALLVVAQMASLGNQLITGSLNNLLMIVAVMTLGPTSGLTVAVVSPILAKLIGIGPLWSLIPFIVAGNLALILIWLFIGNRKTGSGHIARVAALIFAAAGKFFVLYIVIVRIAVPVLLGLPENQTVNNSLCAYRGRRFNLCHQ